jgi:hypothetical protein
MAEALIVPEKCRLPAGTRAIEHASIDAAQDQ